MEQAAAESESKLPEKEKVLLEWRGPSRPYRKSGQFLTLPMVIGILVGIILAFAGEWMLIAVIASLVFAYYTWTVIPPEQVNYTLTNKGIKINNQLFVWPALTRWWVTEKWSHKIVVVEIPLYQTGRLYLLIGDTAMEQIEAILNKYLIKEKPEETGMEKAGKWMAEKFPLEEKI